MNDVKKAKEKKELWSTTKMEKLREILLWPSALLNIVTFVLWFTAFEPVSCGILVSCTLLLTSISLYLDGYCKKCLFLITDGLSFMIWFIILIVIFFKF